MTAPRRATLLHNPSAGDALAVLPAAPDPARDGEMTRLGDSPAFEVVIKPAAVRVIATDGDGRGR